ncbi:TPA: hypothetical protein P0Q44_002734 [Staphylococcus aureus]|nr:hypothetical protein [Staphylococcus aureus]
MRLRGGVMLNLVGARAARARAAGAGAGAAARLARAGRHFESWLGLSEKLESW